MNIYVLLCEQEKYYVGRTTQSIPQRFKQHLDGNGSAWTRKYKPLYVVEKKKNASEWDEDAYVKRWMKSKGIDNVRGGSYCQMKLDDISIAALRREIRGATDQCMKCGQEGHFARHCNYKKSKKCTRCNREGHTKAQCYAKTYIENVKVWICEDCDREFDTKKGAIYHQRFHCRGRRKKSSKCKKCGRKGHYANKCYAATHVDGYELFDEFFWD